MAEWSSTTIPWMIRLAHLVDWAAASGVNQHTAERVVAIVTELNSRAAELPDLLADLRSAAEHMTAL